MGGVEAFGIPSVGVYRISGGGGTGGGSGDAGGPSSLGWLRLSKCWTWSPGTPAEASTSSSPLPATGEAVIWPVFQRTVALAYLGREG